MIQFVFILKIELIAFDYWLYVFEILLKLLTLKRQIGHVNVEFSQISTHFLWNRCMHGRRRTGEPVSKSQRQMLHDSTTTITEVFSSAVNPPTRLDCLFSGLMYSQDSVIWSIHVWSIWFGIVPSESIEEWALRLKIKVNIECFFCFCCIMLG